MPSELRYIAFSRVEVLEAMSLLAVRRFAQLGEREILDVGLRGADGKAAFTVLMRATKTSEAVEQAFSNETLAAALVMYCQRNGIPLPRGGRKSIEIEEDRVVLRIGQHEAVPADYSHINAESTAAATANDAAAA